MTSKKNNWSKIIIAVILIGVLGLFLARPLFVNKHHRTVEKKSEKSIDMEPQFTLEGSLTFLSPEKDTIKTVELEIADNEQERMQGMMYRSSMSYDRAMLFIMQYDREQSFWMRNTKLSLDIIYVSSDFEIETIYKHTQPYSESPIPSFKKAKYVVETTAGFCDKFGVKEGDFIAFERL